jgi:hypothetical protein
MGEKKMWMDRIAAELDDMDVKTVSLVYFFVLGLKGKGKKK